MYAQLGQGLDGLGIARFLAREGDISTLQRIRPGSGACLACSVCTWRYVSGAQVLGREADCASQSSDDVKHAWSYTATHPYSSRKENAYAMFQTTTLSCWDTSVLHTLPILISGIKPIL